MIPISPIQLDPYSAAIGAIQESHSRVLNALQSLRSSGLEGLADVQLDLTRAQTSQAANLIVIDALQESERQLLDILA